MPKTGGRQKGTPNKQTTEFSTRLKELNVDLIEEIMVLIRDVSESAPDKKSKLSALVQMLNYVYPTRKSIDLSQEELEALQVFREMMQKSDSEVKQMIQNAAQRSSASFVPQAETIQST